MSTVKGFRVAGEDMLYQDPNIAEEFSENKTYNIGDYVINPVDGKLYRCISTITTGEQWNSSHWTGVNLGAEINNFKSLDDQTKDLIGKINIEWHQGDFNSNGVNQNQYVIYSDPIPVNYNDILKYNCTDNSEVSYKFILCKNTLLEIESYIGTTSKKTGYNEYTITNPQAKYIRLRVGSTTSPVKRVFPSYGYKNFTIYNTNNNSYFSNLLNGLEQKGKEKNIPLKWQYGKLKTSTPFIENNNQYIYSEAIPVQGDDLIEYIFNNNNNSLKMYFCTSDDITSIIGSYDLNSNFGYYTLSSNTQARYIRFNIQSEDDIIPEIGNIIFGAHVFQENDTFISLNDNTPVGSYIVAILKRYKKCKLGTGKFYIGTINMPEESQLIGSGPATQLLHNAENISNPYLIRMATNCVVKDMMLIGSEESIELSNIVQNIHGIGWIGDYSTSQDKENQPKYGTITNCIFKGFLGGAITCDNTGPAVEHGLNVSDIQIYNCNAGINIAYSSEFHRFINVIAYGCYYACVNNGGNNIFVNCGFSNNKIGIITKMVDGSGRNTINNTHGSAIGCVFNHMDRDDITLGKGEAVYIENGVNGFVFNGCQIFYGSIYIKNSQAISFNSCNFGPMRNEEGTTIGLKITVEETDGYFNRDKLYFSNCIFSRQPEITSIETSGQLKIIWDNCYLRSGVAVPENTLTNQELFNIDLNDIKMYNTFQPGGVYTTDVDVIDLTNIDLAMLDDNSDYRYHHCIINCNYGDKFLIQALGMGDGNQQEYHCQYVFIDKDYNILSKSQDYSLNDSIIFFDPTMPIVAPKNTKYLIVNHRIIKNQDWYEPCVYKLSKNPLTNFVGAYQINKLPFIINPSWKQYVIATYDSYLATLIDNKISMSNDCGETWTTAVDISNILNSNDPVICNTHIYSNGTLAFFTKKHAYYLEYNSNTYHEATCYNNNGNIINPAEDINARMIFKNYNDYTERKFITINNTKRDIYIFGNYKYGYDENALIWYSIDMGKSYKIAFDFGIHDNSSSTVYINGYQLNIRHIHGILYYEPNDSYICMTGDYTTPNSTSHLADSSVLELKYNILNDTWSITLLGTGKDYKWTTAAIWNEEIYYSNDNTPGKVLKCKYNDISDLTKHEVILDNMYNDPRHIIFGYNGDMIITQCNNRNISQVEYPDGLPIPISMRREARRIYYSNNRKNFIEITLPLRHIRGNEEVAFIKPLTKDGHVIIGTYERRTSSSEGGYIDTNILPSIYLDEYLHSVGYPQAFGRKI